MSEPVKIAEDLRDLYALTKRNTLGCINNPRVQKLIERVSAAEEEIASVIEFIVPMECQIRVREGGGEENLIASLSVSVAALVRRLSAAEAALALAKEENARLLEWKTAVSSAVKSIPQFSSWTWGGDKEGWGFHFEIVNWLRRSYALLEAERVRLKAPLSDEEWRAGDGRIFRGYRRMFNDIIAARSKAPDGAQE